MGKKNKNQKEKDKRRRAQRRLKLKEFDERWDAAQKKMEKWNRFMIISLVVSMLSAIVWFAAKAKGM